MVGCKLTTEATLAKLLDDLDGHANWLDLKGYEHFAKQVRMSAEILRHVNQYADERDEHGTPWVHNDLKKILAGNFDGRGVKR